eukprot:363483-Prymnesium_polylepis.1
MATGQGPAGTAAVEAEGSSRQSGRTACCPRPCGTRPTRDRGSPSGQCSLRGSLQPRAATSSTSRVRQQSIPGWRRHRVQHRGRCTRLFPAGCRSQTRRRIWSRRRRIGCETRPRSSHPR